MYRGSVRSDISSITGTDVEVDDRSIYLRRKGRFRKLYYRFIHFIWNKDERLFCGLSFLTWVLLTTYYVAFLIVVTGLFFLTFFFGMYVLIDVNTPNSELRPRHELNVMDFARWKYRNGQWIWENNTKKLLFLSNIPLEVQGGPTENILLPRQSIVPIRPQTLGCTHEHLIIKFRESIDSLEQVRFRRYYRRKTTLSEPDVVTIQDIRDVVIFSIPPNQLSVENIKYFHTASMDFFLRALIIYFQYFLQVWDEILARKEEARNKLFQPSILEKEKKTHDELADLRSMVSRAYLILLIGADDAKRFHHIKSNKTGISQGEKDVRFVEFLFQVCARVVWIALLKRNRNLIETELNRMLRSDTYSVTCNLRGGANITQLLKEMDNVLYGQCNSYEKKLLQRSNIGKEIFFGEHDYRMLAIGYSSLENVGERLRYLKIAYSDPEEILVGANVPVGILGYPRSDFDEMLTLRFNRNDDGSVKVWPKMKLPKKSDSSIRKKSVVNIEAKSERTENKVKNKIRKAQCSMWIEYSLNQRDRRNTSSEYSSKLNCSLKI